MACDTTCTPNSNNSNVVFNWVLDTLPTTLFPFNVYFVKIGSQITTYMTDRNANPYLISQHGGTVTLISTDGSITIDGLNIGLSQTILDSIASKVESVTGYGVDNTDPQNPVIKEVKDLPEDFIVSCSDAGVSGSRIKYITDTVRELYLEPNIVPEMEDNALSVTVDGNNIYLVYYTVPAADPTKRQWGVIKINAVLIDNILTPVETDYIQFPLIEFSTTVSSGVTLHGEAFDGQYLYYSTRIPSEAVATTFIKVNAKNLSDYKIETPFNGGGIHSIELYKNYLYYTWVADDESSAHIGRIDTNLRYAEEVFSLNSNVTRFVNEQIPLLIYLDEIYLFTIDNTSASTRYAKFVIQVYSLTGELKRETPVINLDPSVVTGEMAAYWMTAFNGKILLHTAFGASTVKAVIRIDSGFGAVGEEGYTQPTLEEFILSPARNLTDDNTVTRGGVVYLSSETSSSFPSERRLFVIDDYRDFTTLHEYNSDDYFSSGTPPTYVPKETLKTKLSQFENDLIDLGYSFPELYGAVGDGVADDTAAIVACLAANDKVAFTKTYKVASTIDVAANKTLFGYGATSKIITTADITIFKVIGANTTFENLSLYGSGKTSGLLNQIGIWRDRGVSSQTERQNNKITSCSFYDFGLAGYYSTRHRGLDYMGGSIVTACFAKSCNVGFFCDLQGEYNCFVNCQASQCNDGAYFIGGNNNWIGGQLTYNQNGFRLGTGSNDGHCTIEGAKINHSVVYNLLVDNIVNGYRITNCDMYVGWIKINNSANIEISNCDISFIGAPTDEFKITNSTVVVQDCRFVRTPAITDFTGSTIDWLENKFTETPIPGINNLRLQDKQATLVSGSNIKTLNGQSLLGSTDIVIPGGTTNLTYVPSPTNGVVESDTGTDATLTLADTTNAGLLSPADKVKINALPVYTEYSPTAYSEVVTWGGTAPLTQTGTWQATRIGKKVSLRIHLNYATPGVGNASAQIPFPTGCPLPADITGYNLTNAFVETGNGSVSTDVTSSGVAARVILRRVSSTAYTFFTTFTSGAYSAIHIKLEYFTT